TLDLSVTVGVLVICRIIRNTDGEVGDKRSQEIRGGMDRFRKHPERSSEDAGRQFQSRQRSVGIDGESGRRYLSRTHRLQVLVTAGGIAWRVHESRRLLFRQSAAVAAARIGYGRANSVCSD